MGVSYYRLLPGSTIFTEPKSTPEQVAIRFERHGDTSKVDDLKITFVEQSAKRGTAPIRDNRGPSDIARGFPATYYQSGSEATGGDYHNYLLDSKTGLDREYSHIRLTEGQTGDGIAFYLLPDGIADGAKEFLFKIEALDSSNNSIQSLSQAIKITDSDSTQSSAPAAFTIDPEAFVNEGDTASVVITRSGGLSNVINLNVSTANGTAKEGSDYTSLNSTITFLAGETTKTISIATKEDSAKESDETFTVSISSSDSLAQFSTSSGTVTIEDDDAEKGNTTNNNTNGNNNTVVTGDGNTVNNTTVINNTTNTVNNNTTTNVTINNSSTSNNTKTTPITSPTTSPMSLATSPLTSLL